MSANTDLQQFTAGLEYGITPSAPATISREDIASWKGQVAPDIAHHFLTHYETLHREYRALLASYDLNRRVYNSAMNFRPVVGQTYYLYAKSADTDMLSLVPPSETFWSGFVTAVRLSASYVWEPVSLPSMS